jgi:opacity protein-like surface antigen
MKSKYYIVAGTLLALLTGTALANDTGPYLGIGFGTAKGSADTTVPIAISETFLSTVTSVTTDDSDSTLRLLAGINLNKLVGVEFNYADLGTSTVTVTDNVSTFTTDRYKTSLDGFGLALVINAPITNKLSGLIKFGLFAWNSDFTANVDFGGSTGIVSAKTSQSGTAPMFGLGLSYRFSPNFGIRGEFERFAIDKEDALLGDINTITANAIVYF